MSGGDLKRSDSSQHDFPSKKVKTDDSQFDDIFSDQTFTGAGDHYNGNEYRQPADTFDVDFDNVRSDFLDDSYGGANRNIGNVTVGGSSSNQFTRTPGNIPQISRDRGSTGSKTIERPKVATSNVPAQLTRTSTGGASNPALNSISNQFTPTYTGSNSIHNYTSTLPPSSSYPPVNAVNPEKKFDPSALNDVIAAGGVNLQHEEELLLQQSLSRRSDLSKEARSVMKGARHPSLLTEYHLAAFMNKVSKENGIYQNYMMDADLLELVSAACETWLSGILTKTIVLSRHRRRGIPNLNTKTGGTNKKGGASAAGNAQSASNIPRSELSKELRNLASRQKELEEKRVSKRILLGLEKSAENGGDPGSGGDAKAGAEETLHRAANATAAMMTMNPGRKKYSWMTSNSNAADTSKVGADKEGKGKVSTIISIRGDNGLRFREIRSGNSIILKDLLSAIEDERMGTEKAIIKGYAKLKD